MSSLFALEQIDNLGPPDAGYLIDQFCSLAGLPVGS